jgi:hypothetical protein
MLQRARNALTLLSAAVCVIAAIWVGRSYFRMDQVGVSIGQGRLWLTTLDAQVIIAWDAPNAPVRPFFQSYDASKMRPAAALLWSRLRGIRALGVGWNLSGTQDERLVLPLWLLALLTAIPPVRWWRARRRCETRGFAVETVAQA